jgi:hypothetical protein
MRLKGWVLTAASLGFALFAVAPARTHAAALRAKTPTVPSFPDTAPSPLKVPATVRSFNSPKDLQTWAGGLAALHGDPNYADAFVVMAGTGKATADKKTGRISLSADQIPHPPPGLAFGGVITEGVSITFPGKKKATVTARIEVTQLQPPANNEFACIMLHFCQNDGKTTYNLQDKCFLLNKPGVYTYSLDPAAMVLGSTYFASAECRTWSSVAPNPPPTVSLNARVASITWSIK